MENKSTFYKSALNSGLVFGIILIIIQLGMWMFNFIPVGIKQGLLTLLFSMILSVVVLYFFIKAYRVNSLNGYISYGKAFNYGFTVYLVATVILTIYTLIFNEFIDQEYTTRALEKSVTWTEEFMRKQGLSEEQISSAIDKMMERGQPSIGKTVITTLISGVIFGAIISLISSAFAKKVEEPFK